jgi:hypothetical protein
VEPGRQVEWAKSVGPGGWWSWPAVVLVAGFIPAGTWSGVSLFGLRPITVCAALSLLMLVALWWDDLTPRIAWNPAGFAARGPWGTYRGPWVEAASVFLVALGKGRYGYRIVVNTPSGRYSVHPQWAGWLARLSWRHATKAQRALHEIRVTRDASALTAVDGEPPRLLSPRIQLGIVVAVWVAGLALAVPFA